MKDGEFLADLIVYLARAVRKTVIELSREELTWQPDTESNSIGSTVYHFSRWLDALTVRVCEGRSTSEEQ
ncbi:MAG: hypothetical protein J2P37_30070 [Ktedonobacteraceae bacterium]|nr:hypothetical protein [Ktedonobacteraceae bacterium]MBO0789736.1 hypothetical protein [Ktedonobacteraceae bacterium]